MCEIEKERERGSVCMRFCVCVKWREIGYACVCVCVSEIEKEGAIMLCEDKSRQTFKLSCDADGAN